MLSPEQLAARKHWLGASEIAGIMGLSPYPDSNPYTIWMDKKGMLEPKESTEDMDIGNRLEPVLMQRASEIVGPLRMQVEVAAPDGIPIVSTLDGLSAAPVIVEGKAVGIRRGFVDKGEWGPDGSDEVPDDKVIQCLTQLLCEPRAPHVFLTTILGGRGFADFQISRSRRGAAEAMQAIAEVSRRFWTINVIGNVPPDGPMPGLETFKRIIRVPAKTVDLPDGLVERWETAKASAATMVAKADEAKAAVLMAMGDADGGRLPDGRLVTYYESQRKGCVVEPTTFRTLRVKKAGGR